MSLHVETTSMMVNDEDAAIHEIVLLNEEKSRSFWCWKVYPNATLLRLVGHVDSVLKSYNQPLYYRPAHFHVSTASYPGNIMLREGSAVGEGVDEEVQSHFQNNVQIEVSDLLTMWNR